MKTDYDKFYVVNWNTNEVISEHSTLNAAKRSAKLTGPEIIDGRYTGPVAYVGVIPADYGKLCVLWRPKFTAL